jgi:membrane protein
MLKQLITVPTENLGRWSRFAILQLRIWRQCFRLLMQNRSRTIAAALSYHTVFGIVPLAIITVMVFQIFPAYRDVGDRVKNFAYEQLNLNEIKYPAAESDTEVEKKSITIAEKLDELTDTYISKLNRGAIRFISAIIVIWAAVGLLTTIERACNNIWRVGRGRNFLNRIINYWALLTLVPLLLGAGFYVSTNYLRFSELQRGITGYMQPVLPYMISMIAFFFLYYVMPNTKVSSGAALWGAVVAALLWTAAKYGFRIYVTHVIPGWAVYGILGIIPLAVFWIYITWLIVLFGLQLTYATQHVKTLDAAELATMRRREERFLANDLSAFKVMTCVLDAFEKKEEQPVSVAEVCAALDMPDELGEKMLDHFVRAGLLCQTDEPKIGYVPSTEGENITLADIHDALGKASFAQDEESTTERLKQIETEMRRQLNEHTLKEVLKQNTSVVPARSPGDEDYTEDEDLPEEDPFSLQ